jgi:hypothetical protein
VLGVWLVVAVGFFGYRWAAAISADPRLSVRGLRLGMTADDVRSRVDETGPGEWTSRLDRGDWVLVHEAPNETSSFELHEGQLVAIRYEAPADADLGAGPEFEMTRGSVLTRHLEGGRVRITLLSRDCPTHHDEAEQLVAAHATSP